MLASIAFYALAAIVVLSALAVVSARNPVHSVLFLILSFFTSAGLFVLLGAEFLAMLLVVVYVGAVAVLFLFVVMMLDVDFVELKQGFLALSCRLARWSASALLAELVLVSSAAMSTNGAPIAIAPGRRQRDHQRASHRARCSTPIICCCSNWRAWCCSSP